MTLSLEDQIIKQLLRSQHVLLLPSAPADGDSLGSALALYKILKKLGKKATVLSSEPVPKDLKFLPLIDQIGDSGGNTVGSDFVITVKASIKNVVHEIMPGKVNIMLTPEDDSGPIQKEQVSFGGDLSEFDLLVTVDTGDLQQLGKFYEENIELFHRLPLINIDHHASNSEFGTLNHIDITASATTEMLVPMIKNLEQQTGQELMDPDIATLLLAGIITDTGSFQHSNTTPKAFSVAAELLDYGARQQEIIKNVYKTKSLATLKLWGQVLSKIQFSKEYRFVWSTVSQEDLKETGAEMEDTGAIIDELLNNAPGAEVVLLIKEKQPGLVSCSLRTTTVDADASQIAGLFGGGGHKRAAGCRIKGVEFRQAVQKVLKGIFEYQANRLGLPVPHTVKENHDTQIPGVTIHEGSGSITGGAEGMGGNFYQFEK